nr:MAG TPA: hypothetical protein [Caudoviricetes sp.]
MCRLYGEQLSRPYRRPLWQYCNCPAGQRATRRGDLTGVT